MPTTTLSNDSIIAQIGALERRIRQLEQQLGATTDSAAKSNQPDELRTLRELFEYTVLRPVDLVKLDGDPYFMYVKDLAYTHFAEHNPESFIRNYQLKDHDLQPLQPYPFTIEDFLEGRCSALARNEHYFKLVICAHLWLHDVAFALLDIGANVGYSAVPCAKFMQRFNRSNRIYAFEPGMTGDLLRANIDLNHVGELVIPDSRAVSDHCGPVKMTSMLGHSVCDSISDFRKHYPHLVPAITRVVNRVTVDAFVREKNITAMLVMKVDAEGHDWQVLQGARESFERGQIGVAIVEFVPHYLKEFIDPGQMLIDLARDHHLLSILELQKGYHWKGRTLPDEPAKLREFAQQVARSPLTYTDIVAVSRHLPGAEQLVKRLCD